MCLCHCETVDESLQHIETIVKDTCNIFNSIRVILSSNACMNGKYNQGEWRTNTKCSTELCRTESEMDDKT